MPRHVIEGLGGFRALIGVPTPPTEWFVVDQERVDAFAVCSGDSQWIHVDVARAQTSEFGGTVAHGYLTLALIPQLWHSHFEVQGVETAVNIGLDRVRFPAPLRSGSRIRAHFSILEATEKEQGWRVVKRATIEADNAAKPVCIADTIVLYRPARS
jgi:acyl dehydratase